MIKTKKFYCSVHVEGSSIGAPAILPTGIAEIAVTLLDNDDPDVLVTKADLYFSEQLRGLIQAALVDELQQRKELEEKQAAFIEAQKKKALAESNVEHPETAQPAVPAPSVAPIPAESNTDA